MVYTGEGFEIDVRYTNDGPTAPSFIRTRDRMGNVLTRIDNPTHETGDGDLGFHLYATMPDEHFIEQLEVGYGTAMNPSEITDVMILFIINIKKPAPPPGMTIFRMEYEWPIILWSPLVVMGFLPGQTITKTTTIESLRTDAPIHKITLGIQSMYGDNIADVNPLFTVDGVKYKSGTVLEIAGGEALTFGITGTMTPDMPKKKYHFAVIMKKVEVLE